MGIEQHLTSVKTSLALKKLGIPQKSYRHWAWDIDDYEIKAGGPSLLLKGNLPEDCSAFMATELLEWLPYELKFEDEIYLIEIRSRTWNQEYPESLTENQFCVAYWTKDRTKILHVDKKDPQPFMHCNSISEALAQLLIYLVENKIVSFDKTYSLVIEGTVAEFKEGTVQPDTRSLGELKYDSNDQLTH